MTFELSDLLVQKILFAMENQTVKSALDATIPDVIYLNTQDEKVNQIDENVIFSLPEWSSKDGYALLEEFAFSLHSPLVKQELKDILLTGRGVFRNFKNAVKQYPEIERKWHFFKNKKMMARIYQWYNALREGWGLESLVADADNFEETDELVLSDFVFKSFEDKSDKEAVLCAIKQISSDVSLDCPQGVLLALESINNYFFEYGEKADIGIVCKSISGEFVGCIIGSFSPADCKKTIVVKTFFVQEGFRGLGIANELMSEFFESAKGARQIVFPPSIVRESMQSLLTRFNFKNLGCGYYADLSA